MWKVTWGQQDTNTYYIGMSFHKRKANGLCCCQLASYNSISSYVEKHSICQKVLADMWYKGNDCYYSETSMHKIILNTNTWIQKNYTLLVIKQ